MLLRHADIDLPPAASDPSLNDAGRARAEKLVHIFRDAGVGGVFASEWQRTQQTAQPLAAQLGLAVQIRQAAATSDLAAEILRDHFGGTVVVVGHSNTVPDVAAALGAPWDGSISESEFDNLLWVTVLCRRRRSVHHLHY